jgi:AsmA-like protein
VVLLALAIFLPPNINGVRFRDTLAGSLSSALGRQVRIEQVKYRVFPRPGFDIYGLQVMDDPAFSAEPLLMCGKVAADLRLASLWHGRLEIANLKLTDDAAPPSLNLVYSKGHLNVESLMLRVEQVPSAPTSKRRAEQRPRFPYIEATNGRINFKRGPEKTPFTLANTDFALWLAAEDVWHVRLEGQPVRTDMSMSDTGTVRMEGDFRRSPDLPQMPLKLDVAWDNAQLGQWSTLVMGRDRGWRGGLKGNAQLSGTAAKLHIVASAELNEFRRYDINRNQMPRLRTRCLGDYVHESLELKCDTPLQSGGVLLTARWSSKQPRDYDLSMVATRVPLSMLTTFARHARRPVPDDLTATGDLNAAFGFHSHNGVRNWHGTGMTSPFLLQSSGADKPFPVGAVHFHIGPEETPAAFVSKKGKQKEKVPAEQKDTLSIDAFSIQMGPSTTVQVQATADAAGYWIGAKGMVPLERLLALGHITGFPSEIENTTASAVVDLNITGPWANFAPPHLRGTAHIENLTAWIPGIKDRLIITQTDAQLNEVELILAHLKGQFEHSPISFSGTINVPASCPGSTLCPLEFDLHADTLAMSDIGTVLGVTDKGWNIPFFSDSSKLPEFRATGTVSVGEFSVAQLPLEKFTAHVEVGDKALLVSGINAKLAGGAAQGEWHADWSTSRPRFTATGNVNGVAMDHLDSKEPGVALVTSWISGRADINYALKFEGATPGEMAHSVNGRVEYLVSNGISHSLLLDGSKPLRFQSLQGALEIEKQTIRLLPSKFKAENRIYDMSGTVSLADKQAKLRLSNSGSRWDITGTLEKPEIASPPRAEATAARSQ